MISPSGVKWFLEVNHQRIQKTSEFSGYRLKKNNDNSESPFKNFSFEFKIRLPYTFHNLLNGDNLQADNPRIRKIPSYPFHVQCKIQYLGIFYDA